LVWLACGFGGGLWHKDLCGFLTGGMMGLGLAAGELGKDRDEGIKICKAFNSEYWDWWTSKVPPKCGEITGENPNIETTIKTCTNLGQLAAAKVEELIKAAKASG
jgi:hypothetical protein